MDPVSVGAWVAVLLGLSTLGYKVWKAIVWLHRAVNAEMESRRRMDKLVTMELTHNGGSSMKDATTKAQNSAAEAVATAADAREIALRTEMSVRDLHSILTTYMVATGTTLADIRKEVDQLLTHDAERDAPGHRYG